MSSNATSPWKVSGCDFPLREARSARLEFLVRYAVLAPSTHNTQPWSFRVNGNALELFADRSRSLPIADPRDRELTISCGAALQFARLAARNFGWLGDIELMPDVANQDLLARLRLGTPSAPTSGDARRFRAIEDRRTNRTLFESGDVPLRLPELESLAALYGVTFTATRDMAVRKRIASLVVEADLQQMNASDYRRELANWVRSRRSRTRDGMSLSSFGSSEWLTRPASLVTRAFNIGTGTAARHEQALLSAPWVALLSTIADDPKAWLRAGMALADIVLELTAEGFACSFFSQPLQIDELRPRISEAMGADGFAQILMRIGRGSAVPETSRRAADDVLDIQA